MIIDLEKTDIFIQPGPTDLRKAINGLSIHVQDEMQNDPFSGSLFLFCNRSRKLLKLIYWDRNGFCLWLKRLEQDKFPWPKNKAEAQRITFDQLKLLLDGIDFWKAHRKLTYSKVG